MKTNFNSLEGKILIASPKLEDRFFEKSLIYIFMHDRNGVLGVILNHEIGSVSNHELLKLFDKNIDKIKDEKLPIVFGGPVDTERIIALSIDKKQEQQFSSLQSIVLHTDIQKFVKNFIIKSNKSKFLLARGISAWDSNQLEDEIAENSWFIIQPKMELIFSHEIKNKWLFAIEQLGIKDSSFIAPYSGNA
jgi:putative transcriptional regulator